MVKKIAEKFNRMSRVHQRHRQQTDDRIAIAFSERNVVTFAKNDKQIKTQQIIQTKQKHEWAPKFLYKTKVNNVSWKCIPYIFYSLAEKVVEMVEKCGLYNL